MNREKRYLHTRHILGFIGRELGKYNDIELHCRNGVLHTNCLILAALSPLIKEFIKQSTQSINDNPVIIIPEANTEDIQTLFRYLFSTNVNKTFAMDDLPRLENAANFLHITDIPSLFRTDSRAPEHAEPDEAIDEDGMETSAEVPEVEDEFLGEVEDEEMCYDDSVGRVQEGQDLKGRTEPYLVSEAQNVSPQEPDLDSTQESVSSSKDTVQVRKAVRQNPKPSFKPSSFTVVEHSEEPLSNKRVRRPPRKLLQDTTEKKLFVRNKTGTGSLKCKFCSAKYYHIKARNKHMLSEHLELCKRAGLFFSCGSCGALFTSHMGRAKHILRLHPTAKPPDLIGHPVDAIEEERKVDLRYLDETEVRCPFEGSLFKTVKDLKVHIRDVHPEKVDLSCMACGVDCGSKEALLSHIQLHKTGSKEAINLINCDHCNMKFLSEYNLVNHKRDVHSTNQSLSCTICGKIFKNSKFLKNHEDRHKTGEISAEDGEYRCGFVTDEVRGTVCSKIFKQRSNLERHIRSHTRTKSHRCEECGKCFVDSTRLKEHRWIHSDYKPHKCQHCDKVFRHLSHLRNHEANSHGAIKEHACDQCPKKFVYAYQLRTHINSVHINGKAESKKVNKGTKEQQPVVRPGRSAVDEAVNIVLQGEPEQPPNNGDIIHTVYQCSLCSAVFATYPDLQNHCASHSLDQLTAAAVAGGSGGGKVIGNIPGGTTTTTQVLNVGNEQILLEVTNDVNNDGTRIEGLVDGVIAAGSGSQDQGASGQEYYVLYESEDSHLPIGRESITAPRR